MQISNFCRSSTAERELQILRKKYLKDGLFNYQAKWVVVEIAKTAFWYGAGVALWSAGLGVLAFICFTIATIDRVWWLHDAGHLGVFRSKKANIFWGNFGCIVWCGMPLEGFRRDHELHHRFTNIIGKDRALETGPFVWDDAMLGRTFRWFLRWQTLAWFLIALPLTLPSFLVCGIKDAYKRRRYELIALTGLRWASLAYFAPSYFGVHVLSFLAGGAVIGFFASLNHFHMPKAHNYSKSYISAMVERTQNIHSCGPLWRWLSGGLNHHIEHHLFPSLPQRHLSKISKDIKILCERHGIAYNTCSKWVAVRHLWEKLNIYNENRYVPSEEAQGLDSDQRAAA